LRELLQVSVFEAPYGNSEIKVGFMRNRSHGKKAGARGFTMVELLIVVIVGITLTAMAIPKIISTARTYRSMGDARALSDEVSLAKMRAAAAFTDARVYADTANSLYRVEVWNRTSNCWMSDGDTQCSATYASPATPPSTYYLSSGVTYGFGSLASPPANTQGTIGQAAQCQTDAQTVSKSAGSTANSVCIVFNSRGIPVDNTLAPTSTDAVYVTDQNAVYGVTVLSTGLIQTWRAGLAAGSGTFINR
jgi:Tfp pilus assembly protein FimT